MILTTGPIFGAQVLTISPFGVLIQTAGDQTAVGVTNYILLETGDKVLLETGDGTLLEA